MLRRALNESLKENRNNKSSDLFRPNTPDLLGWTRAKARRRDLFAVCHTNDASLQIRDARRRAGGRALSTSAHGAPDSCLCNLITCARRAKTHDKHNQNIITIKGEKTAHSSLSVSATTLHSEGLLLSQQQQR